MLLKTLISLFGLLSVALSIPINGSAILASRRGGDVGCKNERGESVDWFIVYKLPELPSSSDSLENSGIAHLYMDESTNGEWRRSTTGFDSTEQAVGHTVSQIYGGSNEAFHVMYNDECPSGKTSDTKGHAKGVAMFDQTSGFWMLHSVPKFPPPNRYSFPTTGRVFGQMFLCVSFPYERLGEIADQMILYEPDVYSFSLPSPIGQHFPSVSAINDGQSRSSGPLKRVSKLMSSGGTTFTSFAKHGKWGGELYADLVAPTLKESLSVETWQNGRGDIPSNCKGSYQVKNVVEVQPTSGVDFSNSKDHSKWAVSTGGHWVCIGGINRQTHQMARGGGTMCMENPKVWSKFSAMVENVQSCKA